MRKCEAGLRALKVKSIQSTVYNGVFHHHIIYLSCWLSIQLESYRHDAQRNLAALARLISFSHFCSKYSGCNSLSQS